MLIGAAAALGVVTTGVLALQAVLLSRALAALFHRPVQAGVVLSALELFVAVTALRAILLALGTLAGTHAANRVRGELRREALAGALARGPAWLSGERAGELAVTFGRGLDALDTYVGDYLPRLALAVLGPATLLAVIAGLDWLSAVILVVALATVPVFMVLIGRLTQARVQERWQSLSALGAHFLDAVEGLATLRAFGRARRQLAQIAEVTDELRRTTLAVLRETFLSALVLETLAAIGTALVAVPLALRLLAGEVHLAPALAVLMLTPEVFLPLRQASADFHAASEGLSAADRVFAVLPTPPDAVLASAARPRPAARGAEGTPRLREEVGPPCASRWEPHEVLASAGAAGLVLREVSVGYDGTRPPVLEGVTLVLGQGERVGLVGPSGSGKSTVLAAVLGFAPLLAGSVALDGVELAATEPEVWRANFAVVPQRPSLFAGSLAANLALGDGEPGPGAMAEALEVAQLTTLMSQLGSRRVDQLGEGGSRLSAGERQRVALARALLRPRRTVLVLDEPTAHLDRATESHVLAALRSCVAGRTLLVATHSEAVLSLVDRVIELEARPALAVLSGALDRDPWVGRVRR